MYNHFKSISLSHRKAPLAIREQLALNEESAKGIMLRLKDFFDVTDVLTVSTCNRTEIYYSSSEDLNEEIIKLLLIEKGITDVQPFLDYFEKYSSGDNAVQHAWPVIRQLLSHPDLDAAQTNAGSEVLSGVIKLSLHQMAAQPQDLGFQAVAGCQCGRHAVLRVHGGEPISPEVDQSRLSAQQGRCGFRRHYLIPHVV